MLCENSDYFLIMDKKKTVLVLIGTRPEAIKMAPVILELQKQQLLDVKVISTGQHREMMTPILEFFNIQPDLDLDIMKPGQTLNHVVIEVIQGLQKNFNNETVDGIFVQGDTASCMASSMWAFMGRIPVFHVEAGLRTGDLQSPWPEEFNRRATALAATMHFTPTEISANSLYQEGFHKDNIEIVGNTVIDALMMVAKRLEEDPDLEQQIQQQFPQIDFNKKIILATVHRRESFGQGLMDIFNALAELAERDDVQVVLPLHLNPHVREASRKILHRSKVILLEPQPYVPFIYLMKKAVLILSDSGGVQEEAPAFRKKVLVLRETTERPESIDAGFCHLVGTNTKNILDMAHDFLNDETKLIPPSHAVNPFGSGDSSQRIVHKVNHYFKLNFSDTEAHP